MAKIFPGRFRRKAIVEKSGFMRPVDVLLRHYWNVDLTQIIFRFDGVPHDFKAASPLRDIGLQHNGKIRTDEASSVPKAFQPVRHAPRSIRILAATHSARAFSEGLKGFVLGFADQCRRYTFRDSRMSAGSSCGI